MSNKKLSTDLINQYFSYQQTLKEEQQAIIDLKQIINHNLLLYKMLSQIPSFPSGLLKEFYFAIQQQDVEVISLLRKRITLVSRRILLKKS